MISVTRLAASMLVLASFGASAQNASNPSASRAAVEGSDEAVVTQHSVRVHGKALPYAAHAGFLSLRDELNEVHGRMFYVSYTVEQAAGSKPRPLIFVWNGGPGSNASLLELGALGPRRMRHAGEAGGQTLVDNEETWLQLADLVFVDPIYAGYSYATKPEYEKQFLSDSGDADAMAEFIRLYRAHYQVQDAPLYLMGESYGTYRAAGVVDVLGRRKIPVKGLLLLSNVLNFATNPDLTTAFLLPNYTATAYAHRKLSDKQQADLQATLAESQQWAESGYLDALIQGDRLSTAQKSAASERLAHFTGIPAAQWEKHDLRLDADLFSVMVLNPDKLDYAGHYDTRMIGKKAGPGAPYDVTADPSLDNGVEEAIVPYLRNELGWERDNLYAGPFGNRWPSPESSRGDWTSVRWDRLNGFGDRGPALASALRSNSSLRVFMASGLYDLATPYAAVEYSVSHLGLSPDARKRIQIVRYEGGHAAYMDPTVRAQFERDAAVFLSGTQGR